MIRDWINQVMGIIEESSLTDDEFNTITLTSIVYTQESFDEISAILVSRGSVSNSVDRLASLFKARGFDPTPPEGQSNIYLGSAL